LEQRGMSILHFTFYMVLNLHLWMVLMSPEQGNWLYHEICDMEQINNLIK